MGAELDSRRGRSSSTYCLMWMIRMNKGKMRMTEEKKDKDDKDKKEEKLRKGWIRMNVFNLIRCSDYTSC